MNYGCRGQMKQNACSLMDNMPLNLKFVDAENRKNAIVQF